MSQQMPPPPRPQDGPPPPSYGAPQYGGQPGRNQTPLIVTLVVVGLVVIGALVAGGVLLLRNNNSDDKPAVEKVATRPSTPEAVQFRPVLKTEPNGCGASTATTSADTACGSDGIRYTLGKVGLDGTHVTEVVAAQSPDKIAWVVNLTLDDAGSKAFAQLTAGLATKTPPENQLAIVVRGKVVTAPSVMSEITGGKVQISAKTRDEAEKTAADITG